MKRKFISVALFGALLAASTSVTTSCKDYDDDISGLQGQITANATNLDELVNEKVNNLTQEINSLKAQEAALETALATAKTELTATIAEAEQGAKDYADIQAAAAQVAAIEASKANIEEARTALQAGIDAANAAIEALNSQVATQAGQIDAFTCCDPYASIAEFEGFGHILGIGWGGANVDSDATADTWGLCCIYAMSNDFKENHPELARRLVYAHEMAIEYMYTHPYNAAMMFADGFDVDPYVALRTIYMKTVAEGRTITWHFSEKNIENFENYYTQYPQIPEEEIPRVSDVSKFMTTDISKDAGVDDFDEFIKKNVDDKFPLGMTFEDWYNEAKKIDDISDDEAVDISKTATSYLNKDLKDRQAYE